MFHNKAQPYHHTQHTTQTLNPRASTWLGRRQNKSLLQQNLEATEYAEVLEPKSFFILPQAAVFLGLLVPGAKLPNNFLGVVL